MKKKIAYYIFIAAFFIVCLVPSAGMLLKGESQPAANEILAQRPELILEDGTFNSEITADTHLLFCRSFCVSPGDDHRICGHTGGSVSGIFC